MSNINAGSLCGPEEIHPITLDGLASRAASFARQTSSERTQRAYAKDMSEFSEWCRAMGLEPIPAQATTIGLYLTACSDRLACATLTRRLAAISTMHRLAGYRLDVRHPAIHDVMRGIRRARGTAQRRVAPATTPIVQALATSCDTSLMGLRDRALILSGFASALRRSELVALDMADIRFVPEGALLTIRRSKMDQEGGGEDVGVVRTGSAFCPVAALQTWFAAADIAEGAVFRRISRHGAMGERLTGQSVALILKRRAEMIGLDARQFAGHSLRAGMATAAAECGVEERIIMRQTRHVGTTVRRYIRSGEIFRHNASGRVGL